MDFSYGCTADTFQNVWVNRVDKIVFRVFQFFPVMNVAIKKARNSFSGGNDSGGGHRTLSFSFFFS